MRDYRVRIFGRGPYAWGEAIETIRARSPRAALEAALLRAQWRFTFADSLDAEILPDALGDCPRTLALWKRGERQPGVNHAFAWSGSVPCTGTLRCTLCGEDSSELTDAETNASLTGDTTVPYRNARVETEERPEWLALRDMRLR